MSDTSRRAAGPAILSYGFRPFFLAGSAYAGLAILLWLPVHFGVAPAPGVFLPVDWHVHEMLFGYLTAVIAGFLLTAIPNWTGRLPVRGLPLLALVLLWAAGRGAIVFAAPLGWLATAVVDSAFLAALVAAAAREIVAGRNWRNLKVLLPLAVLLAANVLFHLEVRRYGVADMAPRLGLSAAVVLLAVIGGRIVPSFTRNWLVRENPGRLPVPFGRFDVAAIALTVGGLGAWTVAPDHAVSAALLAAAALVQALRLARWAGHRTGRDPLVAILHAAYAFVPLGLALLALSIALPQVAPRAAGVHALAGAIGAMTLAVMVRATLGHTGQALAAGPAARAIFAAILLAGLARVTAAFVPEPWLMHLAGTAWGAAFAGFALAFGGALVSPRRERAV
ncbi:NnrS family protein [Aquibium sp. A9E412]|uniref:NnrS family protein n=1 Tax=Aquibium sp. A9E412 TaxID=2976767 RepID=UPI0025B20F60|nr:NnrS family protein [Aquibium sp. A9E412]MDN2565497.1 NnrS family protein [Aquibium sp. A9E412]